MNKRLTFRTKVLRRSDIDLKLPSLTLTPMKDFSPKRQSFIHFSTVSIIYKSIYNSVK